MQIFMKLNLKPILLIRAVSLICFFGLSSQSMADDKVATCPADHQHMGHGITGHQMDTVNKGFANAKKIAEKVCNDCHGNNGLSKLEDIPNLAGQEVIYLCESLEAYRIKTRIVQAKKELAGKLGERDDYYIPSMNEVADKLSDQDIVDLSIYYAHLHAK